MKVLIRELLFEEVYESTACRLSSWRAAYKGIVPDEYLNNMSVEERAERFRQNFYSDDYAHYCAIYEDKIIGIMTIGKSRDADKPDAGEVYAIYLIEKFWGKGYGREMMSFAVNKLKSMGFNQIILWVLEENSRSRLFYEKCGFILDGTKKEIEIGKPLTEVRYAIKLKLEKKV